MKTVSKIEIINALGETTKSLNQRKKNLIEKLFEIQEACEKEIKGINSYNLIDIEDWGVSFLKRKYNDYMMFDGEVIDEYGGRYDGGDYNEWVPNTNYRKLIEFCEKSTDIIKGMQDALSEELNKIEIITTIKN